eukprot:Pompholyxophrys_sp_v1_NODE_135_length_1649_cov_17.881430.p1 type:complete len:349 gc:universal NODE_135_length_1649_cov_17.881430:398-1444(+)
MAAHQSLFQTVFEHQADESVRIHAVYTVLYQNVSQKDTARYYGKSEATISRWVARFLELGHVGRSKTPHPTWFFDYHRDWIIGFIQKQPLSFAHEIQKSFTKEFGLKISVSSILRTLHERGYTSQVVERRAMEIQLEEVARFVHEINSITPLPHQLLFIDEMSTDNRAMLRKRGWFLCGKRPVWRSFFRRGERLSLLSFLGVDGVLENFQTYGTFDRHLFFECCKKLIDSGKVQQYPGSHSVWILDGASIHIDRDMIEYFYARGIIVLFLPAYAPFFNPIEVLFGMVKRECRNVYKTPGTEHFVLLQVMTSFAVFDASSIFRMCGYLASGHFDPNINFEIVAEKADLN